MDVESNIYVVDTFCLQSGSDINEHSCGRYWQRPLYNYINSNDKGFLHETPPCQNEFEGDNQNSSSAGDVDLSLYISVGVKDNEWNASIHSPPQFMLDPTSSYSNHGTSFKSYQSQKTHDREIGSPFSHLLQI